MTHHPSQNTLPIAPIAPVAPVAPLAASSPKQQATQPATQPATPPEPDSPRPGTRWTDRKQAEFLRQLSATHSVAAAARAVGMSRQSAYRLRSRMKGSAFDLAWDVAFHHSFDNLAHAALDRALNGVEVPVFYQGELVGSYRKFDERLTAAMLALGRRGPMAATGRYGIAAEAQSRAFEDLVACVEMGADVALDREGYFLEKGENA